MRPNLAAPDRRRLRTRTALAVAGSLTASLAVAAPVAQAAVPAAAPTAVPAAAPASATTAVTAAAANRRIGSLLTVRANAAGLGSRFSGTVVDVASGATVWS